MSALSTGGIMGALVSPFGTLASGMARNYFQTLRQKQANQWNIPVQQKEGELLGSYYTGIVPWVDKNAQALRGGFYQPKAQGTMNLTDVQQGLAAGTMTPQDAIAAFQKAQPSYGQDVMNRYEQREKDLQAQQEAKTNEIVKGYEDRYQRGLTNLEGAGKQAGADIDRMYAESGSKLASDAQARGLSSTSVAGNMSLGNERERIGEQGRLAETLRSERAAMDERLSADKLAAQGDLSKFNTLNAGQLTGDTAREAATQGREARGLDKDIFNSQLGIRESAKNDFMNWLHSTMRQGPGIAPLLDAVPDASASHLQQQQADASRGFLGGRSNFTDAASLGFMGSAGLGLAGVPGTSPGSSLFDLMAAGYFGNMGR